MTKSKADQCLDAARVKLDGQLDEAAQAVVRVLKKAGLNTGLLTIIVNTELPKDKKGNAPGIAGVYHNHEGNGDVRMGSLGGHIEAMEQLLKDIIKRAAEMTARRIHEAVEGGGDISDTLGVLMDDNSDRGLGSLIARIGGCSVSHAKVVKDRQRAVKSTPKKAKK